MSSQVQNNTSNGAGANAGITTSASAPVPTSSSAPSTSSAAATVSVTAVPSSKNLLQQLPAGAVLAFQALAATFTNQGNCKKANLWLTAGLVTILSATCIFFSFTDSLVYNGKVYYGVAVPGRLNILNMPEKKEKVVFKHLKPHLKKRGLKTVDWVHAFLSLIVFLTIAGSDVGLQNCFFPVATEDTRQWLRNLPLGMAVMTSFLFMIFPTTRKGIRLDNSTPPATAEDKKEDGTTDVKKPTAANRATAEEKKEEGTTDVKKPAVADRAIASTANLSSIRVDKSSPATAEEKKEDVTTDVKEPVAADRAITSTANQLDIIVDKSSPPATAEGKKEDGTTDVKKPAAADMAITSTANLLQRLPTGPVLAFQTLAASFTNQGKCLHSNYALTVGLVTFLGATCVFSSFTDCIPDPNTGKVYKGVALPRTLHILGMSKKEQRKMFGYSALKERRLRTMDWVHAFFTAVVFLTIAGSDVGLQICFFPNANENTQQLLKNLPLGVAVLSSFVFIIFPTTRKSMGFDDSDYIFLEPGDQKKDPTKIIPDKVQAFVDDHKKK